MLSRIVSGGKAQQWPEDGHHPASHGTPRHHPRLKRPASLAGNHLTLVDGHRITEICLCFRSSFGQCGGCPPGGYRETRIRFHGFRSLDSGERPQHELLRTDKPCRQQSCSNYAAERGHVKRSRGKCGASLEAVFDSSFCVNQACGDQG
jgi:hypothetical protein